MTRTPEQQAAILFPGTEPKAAETPPTTPATPPAAEPPKAEAAPDKAALEKAVADAATPEAKTAAEKALKDFNDAGAPLTMEAVKIPEGLVVAEADSTAFLDIMNNKELAPAQRAQALIDLQAKVAREASEKSTHAWEQMQTEWQNEAKADAKLGGDKLDPALAVIDKAIDAYADNPTQLRELFALTGFGNNIRAIGFLHKLAEAANAAEGRPATGGPPAAGELRTQAQRMYPNLP